MLSPAPLPPGLIVIHGHQPEALRQLLVDWMRRHPLAPLENETLLVQSNGIAQWFTLALAADPDAAQGGGCGIAAAIESLLPSRFVWQAYRSILGPDQVPDRLPCDKPQLIWRLLRLLPTLSGTPAFAPLARFLADDPTGRKHYQLAERLADLFDQYQVYRADWLAAWLRGEAIRIDSQGRPQPLPADQAWQAHLWQAIHADLPAAHRPGSRASLHQAFLNACQTWRDPNPPPGLPRRLMVFGISSMPAQWLEVLAHLSRWSQVLVTVHNPCRHFWADLGDVRPRRAARHTLRPGTAEGSPAGHPLLAAWGQQGRDYIALLGEHDDPARYRDPLWAQGLNIDLFDLADQQPSPATLLGQLQQDVLELRSLAETRAEWPPVAPSRDRSIRFHVAHSALREVEILHDQLLAQLDDDPALHPRDIIVMVPDINAYAAPIDAIFGQIPRDDDRYLPYALADQAREQHDPMLQALAFLLHLPQARLTLAEVFDWLDSPAVCRRFDLTPDACRQLQQWARDTQIRWGLDANHRAQLGLPEAPAQNSWREGLRRMLLGYAVGGDDPLASWHDIAPYGDIGGLDACLLGPLARLIDTLEATLADLVTPAPAAVWHARIHALIERCFAPASTDEWLLHQDIGRALNDWLAACEAAALETPLPLPVVREHLLGALAAGGLGQRFLAGTITFATLMPMRAIPFKVVCLLGMNDGDYPRSRAPNDFDLMAQDRRPGDRSRREDDRYLFLEALLSARQHLHISWVGRSIHDNAERPPSVLVSQLRDHLDAGWRLADPAPPNEQLSARLTAVHRLQPFAPDYFPPPATLAPEHAFTYAREWRDAHAPSPPSATGDPATAADLPPPPVPTELEIGQIAEFLRLPVQPFLRDRLGIQFGRDTEAPTAHEPFAVDRLTQWHLQDLLLTEALAALDQGLPMEPVIARSAAHFRQSGHLPVGSLARPALDTVLAPLPKLLERAQSVRERWPLACPPREILLPFPRLGTTLQGLVDHRWTNADGGRIRRLITASPLIDRQRYRATHFLAPWALHLLAQQDGPLTTVVLGSNGHGYLRPLAADRAAQLLECLTRRYLEACHRPLPLAPKTGFAWVMYREVARLGPIYDGNEFSGGGECAQQPALQRLFPDLASLLASGEFPALADELLAPLLAALTGRDDEATLLLDALPSPTP